MMIRLATRRLLILCSSLRPNSASFNKINKVAKVALLSKRFNSTETSTASSTATATTITNNEGDKQQKPASPQVSKVETSQWFKKLSENFGEYTKKYPEMEKLKLLVDFEKDYTAGNYIEAVLKLEQVVPLEALLVKLNLKPVLMITLSNLAESLKALILSGDVKAISLAPTTLKYHFNDIPTLYTRAIDMIQKETGYWYDMYLPSKLAVLYNNLGSYYSQVRQSNDLALTYFEKAVATRRKILEGNHLSEKERVYESLLLAVALNSTGVALSGKRLKPAYAMFDESKQIFENFVQNQSQFANEEFSVPIAKQFIAITLFHKGSVIEGPKNVEAVEFYNQALSILEGVIQQDGSTLDPSLMKKIQLEYAKVLFKKGCVFHQQRLYKEAENLMRTSMNLIEKNDGPESFMLVTILTSLSSAINKKLSSEPNIPHEVRMQQKQETEVLNKRAQKIAEAYTKVTALTSSKIAKVKSAFSSILGKG